jgi:hypothetical protein
MFLNKEESPILNGIDGKSTGGLFYMLIRSRCVDRNKPEIEELCAAGQPNPV